MTISDKPVPSGGLLKMCNFSFFSAHFWRFLYGRFGGFSIFSKNVRFSQKMKIAWSWRRPCKASEISVGPFCYFLVATRFVWSYFCKNDHFRQAGTFWRPFEDVQIFIFFQHIFENLIFRRFFSRRFEGSPEISVRKFGQNMSARNFCQKNRARGFLSGF